MNLPFIRTLDRRLGPPLCLLLTGWAKALQGLGLAGKGPGQPPRRILFIKLSEMGAVICAVPLLRRIRETYPDAELFFLTFEQNREVFALMGGLLDRDHVLTIRMGSPALFVRDTWRAIRVLSGRKLDVTFDLELFSRFSAILTYLSGAAVRVGFYGYTFEGLYRGGLLTHRIQYNPLLHISRSYYSLAFALKTPVKMSPELDETVPEEALVLPAYVPDDTVVRRMKNTLTEAGVTPGQKILLVHTGEGMLSLREWPLEHHRALARKLLKETDLFLVFIGTKADHNISPLMHELGDTRCLDLNGKTTLAELQALFHISDGLFANDCGLVHLAALSRIKKFIIFGPESPGVFAPLGDKTWILTSGVPCSPCFSAFNHRTSACRDNLCVQKISPDDVFRLISKAL